MERNEMDTAITAIEDANVWGTRKIAEGTFGRKKTKGKWASWEVDSSEPAYGYCSNCPLKWGHKGQCMFVAESKRGRRACAVVAAHSVSAIAKSYHHKKKGCVDGGKGREQLESSVPPRTESTEAHDVAVKALLSLPGTPTVPPVTFPHTRTYPSIEKVLEEAKLVAFTSAMIEEGWDDVEFLHDMCTQTTGIDALKGMLPIVKIGHVHRFVSALRRLCDCDRTP